MDQWAALTLQIYFGAMRAEARYTRSSHRLILPSAP